MMSQPGDAVAAAPEHRKRIVDWALGLALAALASAIVWSGGILAGSADTYLDQAEQVRRSEMEPLSQELDARNDLDSLLSAITKNSVARSSSIAADPEHGKLTTKAKADSMAQRSLRAWESAGHDSALVAGAVVLSFAAPERGLHQATLEMLGAERAMWRAYFQLFDGLARQRRPVPTMDSAFAAHGRMTLSMDAVLEAQRFESRLYNRRVDRFDDMRRRRKAALRDFAIRMAIAGMTFPLSLIAAATVFHYGRTGRWSIAEASRWPEAKPGS